MRATNEDGTLARPMKLREVPSPVLPSRAYCGPRDLHVMAGREGGLWHISVSCPARYPTWDELRDVAWALEPTRSFKVIVPAQGTPYTNLHDHCLHLWEDES